MDAVADLARRARRPAFRRREVPEGEARLGGPALRVDLAAARVFLEDAPEACEIFQRQEDRRLKDNVDPRASRSADLHVKSGQL